MENRNQALRKLFHLPLICSAALLSFAHGSNDVANAVGPLAAILNSAQAGALASQVGVPFWVMLIGAVGISLGLFLFGPRIVRMVGEQITKMNPMRAFCVGAVGGAHGARRLAARPARLDHAYRGRRGVRRRLLPRVLHDP